MLLKRLCAPLAALALLAGGVVAAPAASADPAQDQRLVEAWYGDFLGRAADPGASYWVDRLSGQQPSDVLWSITHSEEYDAGTIANYYAYALDRRTDDGARYWVDGVNEQRFPLEWVLQNILASPEYATYKDGPGLIVGWYDVLLSRTPSAGERQYWQQRQATIGSLGTVREIYYSAEAVELRIRAAYSILLDREPSASEVAYWYDKEVENSVNVRVLIGSTPEYLSLLAA